MRLDAHCSAVQHFDHIAPIWRSLDPSERGTFTVPRHVVAHAAHAGVSVTVGMPSHNPRMVIVLASWHDVQFIGARRFCMVEHGSGQVYQPAPPADTTPDFAHRCGLVLLLAPNEAVAWQARLHHPHARVEVVGSARVESLAALRAGSALASGPAGMVVSPSRVVAERRPVEGGRGSITLPTVAFAWHWPSPLHPAARWAFPYWKRAVHQLAGMDETVRGYRIIGHGHPKCVSHLKAFYKSVGIPWATCEEVITQADTVCFDSTSFGWECAATGIPIVLLDAPWFDTGGEEWGLRFWRHAESGIRIGSGGASDLHAAITRTLIADPCKERRAEAVQSIYPILAGATAASVAALRSLG